MSGFWDMGIDPQTGDMNMSLEAATWHPEEEPEPPRPEPPAGIIHIYGQAAWHDEVTIWGDRLALTRLRDALDKVLSSNLESIEVWAADGEGYDINIFKHDNGAEDWDTWTLAGVPYSEEYAREKREDAIFPWSTDTRPIVSSPSPVPDSDNTAGTSS